MMKLNPNREHRMKVQEKLERNETLYGEPYCPCMPQQNEDTICPCKYMRKYEVCRCGLYVKETE